MAKHVHEIIRSSERRIGVFHSVLHEKHTCSLKILRCRFQWIKEIFLERLITLIFFDEPFHEIKESHDVLATILREFATDQV